MSATAFHVVCLLCGTSCPLPVDRSNVWTWTSGAFTTCTWCLEHLVDLDDGPPAVEAVCNAAIAKHPGRLLAPALFAILPAPTPRQPSRRAQEFQAWLLARGN